MTRKKMANPRNVPLYAVLAGFLIGGLVVLFFVGPRWLITAPEEPAAVAEEAADARKIRASLFFVHEDGTTLSSVEQEVMYGEGTLEQAKRIVEAQIAAPPAPLVSAIPPGTQLRTIFLADADVYIDLTDDLRTNHPGGTTNEILTVYTLVSALTSNLPAITGVQILIDGREVETLAGHLDLRRPIEQDLRWVAE